MNNRILLEHGAGGKLMHELVEMITKRVNGIKRGVDKAIIKTPKGRVAFTTDSFVMKPPVIRGCDIGELSVYGTANDLVTMGAKPEYLSLSLILEEGLESDFLMGIIESIGRAARKSGLKVVTGDVKVVEKGNCDKVFINTSGIGRIYQLLNVSTVNAKLGDAVIITGSVGDHGAAVLAARGEFQLETEISSDCAPLVKVLEALVRGKTPLHSLIDPTRGGLATSLNEIAKSSRVSIEVEEERIPIREEVSSLCEVLGLDPLYMSCEGRLLIFAPLNSTEHALKVLRRLEVSKDACMIGRVIKRSKAGEVRLLTEAGGVRSLPMLHGVPLPRIC